MRGRVKTDKRSGIVNDPNRAADPQYILRLLGKVISVKNIVRNCQLGPKNWRRSTL